MALAALNCELAVVEPEVKMPPRNTACGADAEEVNCTGCAAQLASS
jgi:hypothetical protein